MRVRYLRSVDNRCQQHPDGQMSCAFESSQHLPGKNVIYLTRRTINGVVFSHTQAEEAARPPPIPPPSE